MFGHRTRQLMQTQKLLIEQIAALRGRLEQLTSEEPAPLHVHVQHLHVNQASLDKLVFELDKLDVKELSGTLNLGNNFGFAAEGTKKITGDFPRWLSEWTNRPIVRNTNATDANTGTSQTTQTGGNGRASNVRATSKDAPIQTTPNGYSITL